MTTPSADTANSPRPGGDAERAGWPRPGGDAERAGWLRVLAMASGSELARFAAPVLNDFRFKWLRRPEQGLVMVRARIGNTGDRFNVGEATVTRCAVRHHATCGQAVVGVGHVLGLDALRAERVAQADALLQVPALHALLHDSMLRELQGCIDERQRSERARTAESRVRFFTLQPETA